MIPNKRLRAQQHQDDKDNEEIIETLKKQDFELSRVGPNNSYQVYYKRDLTPSNKIKSSYKQNQFFNIDTAPVVETNYQIDKYIKMKNPPDSLVFVRPKVRNAVIATVPLAWKSSQITPQFYVVPVAAFMRYISSFPIVGTVTKTLTKFKGYTTRFGVSAEIKAGVKGGIFGCEASLEVSTGFTYDSTITTDTTETWTQELTEGSYINYQNVLVYAYVYGNSTYDDQTVHDINFYNPGLNMVNTGGRSVFFVPVNRDDPFTLRYSDATNDPIDYNDLTDYLAKHSSRWLDLVPK